MSNLLPLQGRRIVLTRPAGSSDRLAGRLKALGAQVLEIPLLEVRADLDEAVAKEVFADFGAYEWLLFTSRNGVQHFFNAFFRTFDDIRSLGFIRIAAVGKGTVEALADLHLRADLVPERATSNDLGRALAAEQNLANLRILVITGNRNREDLVRMLEQEGAMVDTLQVYSTRSCDLAGNPEAARFRKEGAEAVVFASASAVQAFGEQARHLALEPGATVPALCSFGPATSERMRHAGIPIAVECASPGIDGMIEALVAYFRDKPGA